MTKLNYTNMMHPSFLNKVLRAAHKARRQSVVHVTNKKNVPILSVRYRKDVYGRLGFIITDVLGNNLANEIIKAARMANLALMQALKAPRKHVANFFLQHLRYDFELCKHKSGKSRIVGRNNKIMTSSDVIVPTLTDEYKITIGRRSSCAFLKTKGVECTEACDWELTADGGVFVYLEGGIVDYACKMDNGWCGVYPNLEIAQKYWKLSCI